MACIHPDGSLSAVALLMLDYLLEPHTEQAIVDRADQPMYRIRASLRELMDAGLVERVPEGYCTTVSGRAALQSV
ncbi:hypothetical protein JXA80_13940 [bacterium]|nr:hypothetical protein [candidate division CSSED10-310 bacterium]